MHTYSIVVCVYIYTYMAKAPYMMSEVAALNVLAWWSCWQ